MLRLTNVCNPLRLANDALATNFTNLQIVRWRKPRWIPKAKSKIFKVPPRTVTPEEEKVELMRLYNNYRTQIKSIRRYLISKQSAKLFTSTDPEEQNKIFQEDFARCVEINNKWNENQKLLREKRVAEVLEADLDFARKRIEFELLKKEQRMQEVEQIVQREIELSENHITPENIDAAIDHALTHPVDYNFAINTSGEKIFGRENNESAKQKATVNQ